MHTREEALASARQIIEFFEAHPELKLPYQLQMTSAWPIYFVSKDGMKDFAKAFGSAEKVTTDDEIRLRKKIGCFALEAVAERRDVCELVVVGTEEVPEKVIPAASFPERIEPAYTRQITEWKCSPFLEDLPTVAEGGA